MFSMMIDIGPKFYFVPPQPMRVTYRSRSQTLIFICFVLKFLRSYFIQTFFFFGLVNMSNISFYTIFTHASNQEDLGIFIYVFVKGFLISYHPNPLYTQQQKKRENLLLLN